MFGIFKKKDMHHIAEGMVKERQAKIAVMSPAELGQEIKDALAEYQRLVGHNWTLHRAEYDDATFAAAERDDLHDLLARKNDIPHFDEYVNELKKTDQKWQQFCLKSIEEHLKDGKRYTDESELKTKPWWWLIDRLDQLSPEQRSEI